MWQLPVVPYGLICLSELPFGLWNLCGDGQEDNNAASGVKRLFSWSMPTLSSGLATSLVPVAHDHER